MNLFHPDTLLVLTLIIGGLLPGLSALLSRAHWDQFVTGVITVGLSIANGFFQTWLNSSSRTHYDWRDAAGIAAFTWLVAVMSNLGIWQNTKVVGRLLAAAFLWYSPSPKPVAA